MTENVDNLASSDTVTGSVSQRRRTSAKVCRPAGITIDASLPEIALSPAARHAKPPPPPASSSDCDVIVGGKAIGHWLGLTYQQVRPLIDDKTVPTFKLPGHTKRCALKSTLNETFRQYANRHANRRPIANARAEEKTGVTA